MRAIAYSLNRIAERFPELSEEQLSFMQECLEDCFEIGRTWDTIPILVQEAKPPASQSNANNGSIKQGAVVAAVAEPVSDGPDEKPVPGKTAPRRTGKAGRKPGRKSARGSRRRKRSNRR